MLGGYVDQVNYMKKLFIIVIIFIVQLFFFQKSFAVTPSAYVDHVKITVYYTTPSGAVFSQTGTLVTGGNSTVKFTGDPVNTTSTLTSNDAMTFDTLELSPPLTGTSTYTFGSAPLTLNKDLNILPTAGTASKSLAVNLGANLSLPKNGTITMFPEQANGFPFATLNTTASNYSIYAGRISSNYRAGLIANASNIYLTADSGVLYYRSEEADQGNVGTSTFYITGNGNATINGDKLHAPFYNLTLSGKGIKSNDPNIHGIHVTNILTVEDGAVLDPNTRSIQGDTTGTLVVNNGGTILVKGTDFSSATGSYYNFATVTLNPGSTVQYSAVGAQTIDNTLSYSNLAVSGSGAKSLGGATTVTGTTTVLDGTLSTSDSNHALNTAKISIADSGSAILNANGSTITLNGTSGTLFTRGAAGVFNAGTSTVNVTGAGSAVLNSGDVTFNNLNINATGEKKLGDSITVNGTLTLTQGSINDRDYNVTAGNFSSSNTNIRSLDMGSGTWTLTGTGTVWDMGTSTNATIDSGESTIKLTDTSTTGKTFAGGSKVYNNLWLAPVAGTGSFTISGNNTFNDFSDTGTAAHSILFTAGSTTHIGNWNVVGEGGALITINSTTTGTHTLVKDDGGGVNADYLNIQHSIATPAGVWFAGENSVNNQNTSSTGSGWIFKVLRLYFGGGGGAAEGSGATGTAVVTNNVVTGVTITSGGRNYSTPPAVYFCNGGGSGAAGTAVLSSGLVVNVSISNGGSGYTSTPSVYFGSNCPVGGGGGGGGGGGAEGSGAAGIAVLTNNAVSGVNITSGGSNYSSPPSVAFCSGGGSGATGTAVLEGGSVVGVNINAGGSNYTSIPTVRFGSSCPVGGGGGGGGGGDSGFLYIPSNLAYAGGSGVEPVNLFSLFTSIKKFFSF
jgi:hypothetical protein